SDAALFARGPVLLQGAHSAGIRPIAAQDFARLLDRHVVREALAGGANIRVALGILAEVAAIVTTFRPSVRSRRLRNVDIDPCLLAGHDLLALEAASVGESPEWSLRQAPCVPSGPSILGGPWRCQRCSP